MADYRILLEADTARAEKDLRRVETVADTATRTRKLNLELPSIDKVQKSFNTLKNNVEDASNNIRSFYNVSKLIPGVGEKVQKVEDAFNGTRSAIRGVMDVLSRNSSAGDILANGLSAAAKVGGVLLDNLSKLGLALFGLKQIAGVVQGAFGEFFNQTIGREIALRETLLKTQTTVASMAKVFVNGMEITDPLEKIKALTKSVERNVDSIRERSLELAGVTSSEVVEVFGIVAGQIGQVGGGLKEAEDLAISFAAALGTFGVPLQQARQEITSMLQGNIGADSYLARALGITNSDIAKARTQTDGVVGYIQKKLETAVAGQKLAAQSFSGVLSNIQELGELVGQKFGRGLLDPLLAGLSKVYEWTSAIKDQLYAMAEGAGQTLGNILRIAAVKISVAITGGASDSNVLQTLKNVADAAQRMATNVFSTLTTVATNTIAAIVQVIDALRPSIALVAEAFGRLVKAFAELQVGRFETLVSVVANLTSLLGPALTALSGFFNIWSRILDLPIFQYMSEVAVVLGLLKRVGLDAALMFVSLSGFIMSTAVPAIAKIGLAVGGFIVTLGLLVVALAKVALSIAAMAGAFLAPAAAIPALQAGLVQFIASLRAAGGAAQQTGAELGVLGAGMQAAGASAKSMGSALVTSLGKFALIQIGIAVLVDLFGRFQRAQQEAAARKDAADALKFLEENAKGAAGGLDDVNQALYDYKKAQVDARKGEIMKQIDEVNKKIQEQQQYLLLGKQGWEGVLHTLMWGADVQALAAKRVNELSDQKKQLRAELQRIIAAINEEAAANARAEAASPKGRIEQLQKEEKVRQTLLGIQQQELKNTISQQQLAGQISEKEAKRLESLAEIKNLTSEIAAKQEVLSKLMQPELFEAASEEITKIRGEILALEGKKVQIEIQIKKEAFEQFVKDLERTTAIRTDALNRESQLIQNNLSIEQARVTAEQGRLNYVLQGLQAAKDAARTEGERIGIAQRIATVQKQIADNEYRSALAAIDMGVRQAQIQVEIVRMKEAELRVVMAVAKAQGLLNDAHFDALRAGQQAVLLAEDNLKTVTTSAAYQRQSAEWTRKGAYLQADLAAQSERTATAQSKAADQAGRFADNLKRAFGMSFSRSPLEDWQERYIAQIVDARAKFEGKNFTFADRVELEVALSRYFRAPDTRKQSQDDRAKLDEFRRLYGPLPFAKGGVVNGPTLALVGEGGESEYIIPASKMAAAVANYARGLRGRAVIPKFATGGYVGNITNTSDPMQNRANIAFNKRLLQQQAKGYLLDVPLRPVQEALKELTEAIVETNSKSPLSQPANPPQITINTGPVTVFDGKKYVTLGQFERGLQQVAESVYKGLRKPSTRVALALS